MDKNSLFLLLALPFLLANKTIVGNQDVVVNKNNYLPYLQVGGTRFFNAQSSNSATSLDIFMPVLQQPTWLVFTDVRLYDRSGKPFEGNIHAGYHHLLPEKQQLYGIYGAFDRKRTGLGNYFNQLTLGGECWWGSTFLGANFYQPIGNTSKLTEATESADLKQISSNIYNIWITNNEKYEKAMGGIDAEAGYEFRQGLTGYLGGYYFKAKDIDTICGSKAKLAYDWSLENGKKIGGIFDKIGLEAGVQNDKPRSTIWYLTANFRIGLLPNRNPVIQDASHHMVDLIRRDVDIISSENQNTRHEVYTENGEIVTIGIESGSLKFITGNKKLIIGTHLDIVSPRGHMHRLKMPIIIPIPESPKPEPQVRNIIETPSQNNTNNQKTDLPKIAREDETPKTPTPIQTITQNQKEDVSTALIQVQPIAEILALSENNNQRNELSRAIQQEEAQKALIPTQPVAETLKPNDTTNIPESTSSTKMLENIASDIHPLLGFSSDEASKILIKSISSIRPTLALSGEEAGQIPIRALSDTQILASSGINSFSDIFYTIPILSTIVVVNIVKASYIGYLYNFASICRLPLSSYTNRFSIFSRIGLN